MNERDDAFVEKVRETLDESVRGIDAGTSARLESARASALEGLRAKEERRGGRGSRGRMGRRQSLVPMPVAGLVMATAVCLAAAVVFFKPAGPGVYDHLNDVEILATVEEFELVDELDFYSWLAEREDDAV
jgi:hypothetical protein